MHPQRETLRACGVRAGDKPCARTEREREKGENHAHKKKERASKQARERGCVEEMLYRA